MPVAYRLIELTMKRDGQNPGQTFGIRIPVHVLTISGSKEEGTDVEDERHAFIKLMRDARRYSKEPSVDAIKGTLTRVLFGGYLSAIGLGDTYAEWAVAGTGQFPIREHSVAYEQASTFANLIVDEPALVYSGSIPAHLGRLARLLKKYKANAFTALLIGRYEVYGKPLSPFLLVEFSIAGVLSYAIIAVGTAAADRVSKFVKNVGEEKHRSRQRRRRRLR